MKLQKVPSSGSASSSSSEHRNKSDHSTSTDDLPSAQSLIYEQLLDIIGQFPAIASQTMNSEQQQHQQLQQQNQEAAASLNQQFQLWNMLQAGQMNVGGGGVGGELHAIFIEHNTSHNEIFVVRHGAPPVSSLHIEPIIVDPETDAFLEDDDEAGLGGPELAQHVWAGEEVFGGPEDAADDEDDEHQANNNGNGMMMPNGIAPEAPMDDEDEWEDVEDEEVQFLVIFINTCLVGIQKEN